jgi:hypothetical protein
MSLIIVEDTLVSATDMSFSSEVWINHICMQSDTKILFWQSPAYASLNDVEHSLNTRSIYPRSQTYTNNCFTDEETNILKSNLRMFATNTKHEIRNYLDSFRSKLLEYPFKLPYITYNKNIAIGAAITQCLLTYFPDSHFEVGKQHINFIMQVCEQIISGIELLTFIHNEYDVHSLLLSEHVYNASALVEFTKINNIRCPKLQDAIHSDTPSSLVHDQGSRSDWHSRFALLYEKRKDLCHKNKNEGRIFLENLVNRLTNINPSDNEKNRLKMNSFLGSIDPAITIFTPKEYILGSNQRKFNVILYLNAYSDAAYSLGSAGYVSSATFFIDIALKLTDRLGKENVSFLLKIHPNMFLPYDDPTAHRVSQVERDKLIITKLYNTLKGIANIAGVLSPESTPKQISAIPSLLNITHHGTIGLELMHLKSPVLYTICAPYSGLQISKIEIDTKQNLEFYIKNMNENLFKVEEYGINFDTLYAYMYAFQYSPEILHFKLREEIKNMQTKHISLKKCLQELETKTVTIKELIPKDISNCYTYLSKIALNNYDI